MLKILALLALLMLLAGNVASCTVNSDTPILSPVASPKTNTPVISSVASPSATAVTSPVPSLTPSQTYSVDQQLIVDDILTNLKQQGVPVKDTRLVNFTVVNPPIELEFTLQSSSNDLKGTPEDPINDYLVMRTANLAQRKGLNVGAIGIVLINNQGQRISSNVSAVTKIDDLPTLDSTPSPLDDAAVSNLLKQKISLSAPSTIDIKVFRGIYDLREIVFDIRVPDLQTANKNIGIIFSIRLYLNDLNLNQDARISDFRIDITDTAGHPLLKLMGDLIGSATSWHADGLANWGYPVPAPAH